MKKSRVLEKIIFILSCSVTVIAMIYLKKPIPSHITAGSYVDEFSSSFYLMMFPIMQLFFILISRNQKLKYCLTHSKIFLTDEQYQWVINGILLFLFLAEGTMLYTAFIV